MFTGIVVASVPDKFILLSEQKASLDAREASLIAKMKILEAAITKLQAELKEAEMAGQAIQKDLAAISTSRAQITALEELGRQKEALEVHKKSIEEEIQSQWKNILA